MAVNTGHLKEEREGKEIKEQPILGSISFLLLARCTRPGIGFPLAIRIEERKDE